MDLWLEYMSDSVPLMDYVAYRILVTLIDHLIIDSWGEPQVVLQP